MALVRFSTPLRRYTNGEPEDKISGSTLEEVIENLEKKYPGIKERILENGEIQKFINIYVNNEDVRLLKGLKTEVKETDVITILPAVSGG